MKTAAAYIRVSTDKQDELSPDAQLRLLRDYAASHDMEIPEEYIFWEIGISGRNAEHRPEFMRMIGLAKSRPSPYQVILVWKFSRFARNQEQSIVYKSLLKKECKVDVVSASEPLIEGPFGSLIERIIEWMDEYYSIRLSGEVRRGMTQKAMRGEMQCRAPFGYVMRDGRLQIVPEEADIIRTMYRSFLQGKGAKAIARDLNAGGIRTKLGNLWETRTITYILLNPTYTGTVRWNPDGPINHNISRLLDLNHNKGLINAEGRHDAIIPREEWEQVFKIFVSRIKLKDEDGIMNSKVEKAPSDGLHKHYLSGLIKCGCCGTGMTYSSRKDWPHFTCRAYLRGKCQSTGNTIPEKTAVSYLMESLNAVLGGVELDVVPASVMDYDTELAAINRRLDQIAAKMKRAKTAYLDGVDTVEEYRENKAALDAEKGKANKDLQQVLKKINAPINPELMRRNVENLIALLESPDYTMEEKHDALHTVVDHIVWNKSEKTFNVFYKRLI